MRDSPFFYISVNLGGLIALGSASFIQEKFGWSPAFITAGIGMIIAVSTFFFGFHTFENRGLPIPKNQITPLPLRWIRNKISMVFLLLFSILIAYLLLSSTNIANLFQLFLGIFILIALLLMATRLEKRIRNKFFALIILIIASIVFCGMLFQAFASVNLFTERLVNRHIFGILIPPPAFIALETIFLILLGPFLASLSQRLLLKKLNPTGGPGYEIFFSPVFNNY